MANEHDMYLTSALMGRIQEHIARAQESLIQVLKDDPDNLVSRQLHEAIILELKSLLK